MVDALASGASVPRDVEVQVLSRVPKKKLSERMAFSFGLLKLKFSRKVFTAKFQR